MRAALVAAVEGGELHPTAASERGLGLLIALTAGVASQQDANDHGAGFEQGRFTPLIEPALDMYEVYFDPGGSAGQRRTPGPRTAELTVVSNLNTPRGPPGR